VLGLLALSLRRDNVVLALVNPVLVTDFIKLQGKYVQCPFLEYREAQDF